MPGAGNEKPRFYWTDSVEKNKGKPNRNGENANEIALLAALVG